MGYQPQIKKPKGTIHQYKKHLHERRKDRKRLHRRIGKPVSEKKPSATEKEISEVTLKRLHTLGSQKFGSSPFSQHFDRWLTNIAAVLSEFESNPNINVDDQFVMQCSQTLSTIKLQLENRRNKEASVNQEITNLMDCRKRLEQINAEYATLMRANKRRKNSEIKRLYSRIDQLKKDQEKVIRVKTGFFQGISRKDREQKEIMITQELNDKQRELELAILAFKTAQKELHDEYERRKEPLFERIKYFQKTIQNAETDGSLEERWFACEALIDAVNTFLQRKTTQPNF